mgnify:CR=1 FL=1
MTGFSKVPCQPSMADPHLRSGGPLRDRRADAQSHIRGYRSSCGPRLASPGAAAGGSLGVARAGLPVRMGNGAPPSPGLGPAISRDAGGPSRAGVAARRIVQSLRRGPSPDAPRSLIAQAAARLRHVLALAQRLLARGSPEPALPLGPERTVLVRSTSSGSVGGAAPYVHHQVAVWAALPLGPERTVRTATRAWAYRLGTLDVKWQCESHCHSALSVRSRVGGTATRP